MLQKRSPFWLFVSLTSLYPLAIKRCKRWNKKREEKEFFII